MPTVSRWTPRPFSGVVLHTHGDIQFLKHKNNIFPTYLFFLYLCSLDYDTGIEPLTLIIYYKIIFYTHAMTVHDTLKFPKNRLYFPKAVGTGRLVPPPSTI